MSAGRVTHEGLKVSELITSGEGQRAAVEQSPGIYESRGIGNSYLVTTAEGDVLVNAGTLGDARRGRELFDKVSKGPIRTIVLTQSHANQYGGLEIFRAPATRVLAHRLYPEERRHFEMLKPYYRRGSRRIFAAMTASSPEIEPTHEVAPDWLIGDEGHAFELGERRFEVIWAPGGETRCAVVVWLPRERILFAGNLFGPLFGNHPNFNTLRGDKPRRALEFVESARRVRTLKPALVLTGHESIRGAEHIEREITRIVDAVQWVHDRTVEGMNAGKDLRSLMREIWTPPELTLTEEYGKVAWNVRATWHEYTGWFDPSAGTTDLYGVPASCVAPAIADLAGGADRIAERARRFVAEGKPLEALHLLDIALAAAPDCRLCREVKRDALERLLEQTGGKNLWERMWIAAAIRELDI
jgi:alkyl sulfatase BDS1-like metallo-beta-lactamase superfamily hydrolase